MSSIYSCGIGGGREGNPTDWVARDTNIHFEITMQFLENELAKNGVLQGLEFAKLVEMPWYQAGLDWLQPLPS